MVAVGLVDPDRLWRKSGARPGDAIVLGKAIGTGIITTGLKRGEASEEAVDAAVSSMKRLNRDAARVLDGLSVRAVTDVTGYGLLGHLAEVCRASEVSARLNASAPPLLPGTLELAAAGIWPGGTDRNRRSVDLVASWADAVEEPLRMILCDAQTSGGLLACVADDHAQDAVEGLRGVGYEAAVLGVIEEGEPHIHVDA